MDEILAGDDKGAADDFLTQAEKHGVLDRAKAALDRNKSTLLAVATLIVELANLLWKQGA